MRKLAVKQLILLTFCYFDHLSAQKLFLQAEVRQAIFSQCKICSENFPNCYYPVFLMPRYNPAEQDFHYCHMTYMSGNIMQAYQFAQKLITSPGDTITRPLSEYARFLKARILDYRNYHDEAINQYLEFLKLSNKSPALNGAVYISMAAIYMTKQDFINATNYFKAWELSYSTDSIWNGAMLPDSRDNEKKSWLHNKKEKSPNRSMTKMRPNKTYF